MRYIQNQILELITEKNTDEGVREELNDAVILLANAQVRKLELTHKFMDTSYKFIIDEYSNIEEKFNQYLTFKKAYNNNQDPKINKIFLQNTQKRVEQFNNL